MQNFCACHREAIIKKHFWHGLENNTVMGRAVRHPTKEEKKQKKSLRPKVSKSGERAVRTLLSESPTTKQGGPHG
jgi:hypothetical protein